MPKPRPAGAGTRGPIGRQPQLSPTGYRTSARRRFELMMAGRFTGPETLQGVIDLAVTEFLERLHDVPGYAAALKDAEKSQQQRAGVRSAAADGNHSPS